MPRSSYIIFAHENSLRLVIENGTGLREIALAAGNAPQACATELSKALKQEDYRGQGVMLAIPSAWCLCAAVATEGVQKRYTRKTLLYRLESKMPLAVEEVVADFAPGNGQVLGVATTLARLRPLVDALEEKGIQVQSICPAALLAMDNMDRNSLDALLWQDKDQLELFVFDSGDLKRWATLAPRWQDLQWELGSEINERHVTLRLGLCGIDTELKSELTRLGQIELVELPDRSIDQAAAECGVAVLEGKSAPLLELRRDAIAAPDPYRQVRRPLTALLLSLALLLVTVCGTLLWRAREHQKQAVSLQEQQQVLIRQHFAGKAMPVNVKMRLISEEKRLRGLRGEGGELPDSASALMLLRQVLSHLPQDLRYRILEIRLGSDKLYVEGQARSHGEAEAIAAALRRSTQLQLEAPRTEQLQTQGVTFTLSGAILSPSTSKPELSKR